MMVVIISPSVIISVLSLDYCYYYPSTFLPIPLYSSLSVVVVSGFHPFLSHNTRHLRPRG